MAVETAWRKTPSYQGGFILDGGVHYVAATRLLLGESNPIVRVSALTTQLQSHLPPVDTLDAVLKTKSGISGSLNFSFGTTFTRSEYCVACEKGTVVVSKSKVTVKEGEGKDAKERVKEFSDEGSGVKQEVRAWAEGILAGKQDPRQTPEEALKDLEVVSIVMSFILVIDAHDETSWRKCYAAERAMECLRISRYNTDYTPGVDLDKRQMYKHIGGQSQRGGSRLAQCEWDT